MQNRNRKPIKGVIMFQIEHISNHTEKAGVKRCVFSHPGRLCHRDFGCQRLGKIHTAFLHRKKYAGTPDVRIGYVPQENPLYDELKPVDNLRMWTNKHKSEILQALQTPPLAQLGIQTFLDTPVKNMSGGMKNGSASRAPCSMHQRSC